MLSLIPILGPIIQGIITPAFGLVGQIVTSKAEVQKSETAASVQVIETTEHDWGVRLARDLIMFPVALWTAVVTWDNFAVFNLPEWYFKISEYPASLAFLPYVVVAFLFGNAALNVWRKLRG